jgi:transcriptional regulator with XRE-family HTH domain
VPDIPDGAAVDDAPFIDDLPVASVGTVDALSNLLRTVHLRTGLSLRAIEARTRHDPITLHKSTVAGMFKGTRLPRKAVMLAFLQACGVHGEQLDPWRRAWERIADESNRDNFIIGTVSVAPGDRGSVNEDYREDFVGAKSRTQQINTEVSRPVLASVSLEVDTLGPIGHSPTVRRRELGAFLRALRIEQGLTVEQVAEHLLCSPSKVSRMETGHRGIISRDVRDLCDLYGVIDQAERNRLMMLARGGKQQAWWQSYDLSYATYVGLEAEAVVISAFQSSVVPGLLQTADYARAGHERSMPKFDPDEIEKQIEAKLIRQQLLTGEDPPSFTAVLDEAALHRVTGSPRIMRAQLERLVEASHLPNVTIQVLPFAVGAHPALESNFSILELPVTSDVVFVEGMVGSIYLERPEDLERYRRTFGRLRSLALSPEATVGLLVEMCR